MRAMLLRGPVVSAAGANALEPADVAVPAPADDEILIAVSVCGVCRTDLDLVEGRLMPPAYPVIPGHQIVGRVARAPARQPGAARLREGDRVGVAWINWACGVCRWCRAGQENLCPRFRSTGADRDGGYAEYVSAPAAFAYRLPDALDDVLAAPLLCAGAIGWRSLRLTDLRDGDPLGLSGFGASGHLTLQLARHRFPRSPCFVFARSAEERSFARDLGAAWTGAFGETPPAPLGAVIDTTPVWKPIVDVLPHVQPGGRLVINAIRKSSADQDQLLRLDYASHLWMEREVRSVANVTRDDVRETLDAAVRLGLRPTVREFSLDQANDALPGGTAPVHGAAVLRVGSP